MGCMTWSHGLYHLCTVHPLSFLRWTNAIRSERAKEIEARAPSVSEKETKGISFVRGFVDSAKVPSEPYLHPNGKKLWWSNYEMAHSTTTRASFHPCTFTILFYLISETNWANVDMVHVYYSIPFIPTYIHARLCLLSMVGSGMGILHHHQKTLATTMQIYFNYHYPASSPAHGVAQFRSIKKCCCACICVSPHTTKEKSTPWLLLSPSFFPLAPLLTSFPPSRSPPPLFYFHHCPLFVHHVHCPSHGRKRERRTLCLLFFFDLLTNQRQQKDTDGWMVECRMKMNNKTSKEDGPIWTNLGHQAVGASRDHHRCCCTRV